MRIQHHGLWLLLALPTVLTGQQAFAELARRHLPASLSDVLALAAIDIENDGDLDLLVGRFNQPSVIWRNNGFGTFTDTGPSGSLQAIEPTSCFAVGDVNGDGQDDAVWGTIGHGARLLLGGGNTLWPAPSGSLPTTGQYVSAVCLFDLDNDGDLDLIVAEGGSSARNALYANDGSGFFSDVSSQWQSGGPPGVSEFVPFDADVDGDTDLLLLSWNAPPVLLRNSGNMFASMAVAPNLSNANCAAAGDVDGDGDPDLILGFSTSNPALRQDRLLRNSGNAVFFDDTVAAMPVLSNFTSSVHMTDLDGDGDLDAVVGHDQPELFGNRLGFTRLENDGSGIFADTSIALPQNDLAGQRGAMFDVDGDGDDDFVFASAGQHLYWNDAGQLLHATAMALPYRTSNTEGVAAGDLDGDDMPELIAGGWNFSILGGRNSLFWNDGTGRMAEAPSNPAWPIGFYASVDLGDIDGDGDLDVVFGVDQPGQNRLYRNDGNRMFTDLTATAMPSGTNYTRVVRFFDADGDGDLDLLVGNTGSSQLLNNDGLGNFTVATGALPASSGTRAFAIGDVDLDGDLDIVRASDTSANELWHNMGGTFQSVPANMPTGIQATEDIALADLDGDGDLDMLVGNADTGLDPRSWLIFNTGGGSFTGTAISLGSVDVRAIAAADIEGDGDVDFVLGGHLTPVRLFENVGAGSFVSQSASMPIDLRQTEDLRLVDLDGDGDLDLFEGDRDADRVVTSLHRQLHGEQLLVLGAPATYAVHAIGGPPGATPFAALSLGFPAAPVLTPFGPVRMDLATIVPVAVLALPPSQPRAEWTLQVPANAALSGLEIGVQALIVHDLQAASWRLSGLAAETIR